jgi:hypothetical protein
VSLSTTSLTLPQTFINQQVQASFVIWNGGGGTLTGTVSAPAPFSIMSGGSFSLLPGQPQEVVVRFSSGTAGSFSKSITISSNGGSATVTATGVAHKVSFSPAQLDFGSGLFVMREQCDDTGGVAGHREGGVADREGAHSEERGNCSGFTDAEHGSAVQDRECVAHAVAGAERSSDLTIRSQ